jgi:hypothetical protein
VLLKYLQSRLQFLDDVCKIGVQASVAYLYGSDGYLLYISHRKYRDLWYAGL